MEQKPCGVFRDFGTKVIARELKRFKRIMASLNVDFFLIGGCCLGLVREKDFLGHDKDIDIGIFENANLKKLSAGLIKAGYAHVAIAGMEKGKYLWAMKDMGDTLLVFEIQVHYRSGDIVYFNRDLEKETAPQGYAEGRVEWPAKFFESLALIASPDGELYYVPSHVEEYLTVQHGDWRTPVEYIDWRYHVKNIREGWIF